MTANKTHSDQLQVVPGTFGGGYPVTQKFAYTKSHDLEYYGEGKGGYPDSANVHHIQKFEYDSRKDLSRVLDATNVAHAGCTEVTVVALASGKAEVTFLNGDASEASDGDQVVVTTSSQSFRGVLKKKSDTLILVFVEEGVAVDETGVPIPLEGVKFTFDGKNTGGFCQRRWDHRERYDYVVQEG